MERPQNSRSQTIALVLLVCSGLVLGSYTPVRVYEPPPAVPGSCNDTQQCAFGWFCARNDKFCVPLDGTLFASATQWGADQHSSRDGAPARWDALTYGLITAASVVLFVVVLIGMRAVRRGRDQYVSYGLSAGLGLLLLLSLVFISFRNAERLPNMDAPPGRGAFCDHPTDLTCLPYRCDVRVNRCFKSCDNDLDCVANRMVCDDSRCRFASDAFDLSTVGAHHPHLDLLPRADGYNKGPFQSRGMGTFSVVVCVYLSILFGHCFGAGRFPMCKRILPNGELHTRSALYTLPCLVLSAVLLVILEFTLYERITLDPTLQLAVAPNKTCLTHAQCYPYGCDLLHSSSDSSSEPVQQLVATYGGGGLCRTQCAADYHCLEGYKCNDGACERDCSWFAEAADGLYDARVTGVVFSIIFPVMCSVFMLCTLFIGEILCLRTKETGAMEIPYRTVWLLIGINVAAIMCGMMFTYLGGVDMYLPHTGIGVTNRMETYGAACNTVNAIVCEPFLCNVIVGQCFTKCISHVECSWGTHCDSQPTNRYGQIPPPPAPPPTTSSKRSTSSTSRRHNTRHYRGVDASATTGGNTPSRNPSIAVEKRDDTTPTAQPNATSVAEELTQKCSYGLPRSNDDYADYYSDENHAVVKGNRYGPSRRSLSAAMYIAAGLWGGAIAVVVSVAMIRYCWMRLDENPQGPFTGLRSMDGQPGCQSKVQGIALRLMFASGCLCISVTTVAMIGAIVADPTPSHLDEYATLAHSNVACLTNLAAACAPYTCDHNTYGNGTCLTACHSDASCREGYLCQGGRCIGYPTRTIARGLAVPAIVLLFGLVAMVVSVVTTVCVWDTEWRSHREKPCFGICQTDALLGWIFMVTLLVTAASMVGAYMAFGEFEYMHQPQDDGTGHLCNSTQAFQCDPFYCDMRLNKCHETCAVDADCRPSFLCSDAGTCVHSDTQDHPGALAALIVMIILWGVTPLFFGAILPRVLVPACPVRPEVPTEPKTDELPVEPKTDWPPPPTVTDGIPESGGKDDIFPIDPPPYESPEAAGEKNVHPRVYTETEVSTDDAARKRVVQANEGDSEGNPPRRLVPLPIPANLVAPNRHVTPTTAAPEPTTGAPSDASEPASVRALPRIPLQQASFVSMSDVLTGADTPVRTSGRPSGAPPATRDAWASPRAVDGTRKTPF